MNRRDFSARLAVLGTALPLLSESARAQVKLAEGTNYVRLNTPAPITLPAGKKIEVVFAEVFPSSLKPAVKADQDPPPAVPDRKAAPKTPAKDIKGSKPAESGSGRPAKTGGRGRKAKAAKELASVRAP